MFKLYYILFYPLTLICLLLIYIYKLTIKHMINSDCSFIPTCSTYSLWAIREYGAIVGIYYTIKRLIRCRPECKTGYDFVKLNLMGNYKWKC